MWRQEAKRLSAMSETSYRTGTRRGTDCFSVGTFGLLGFFSLFGGFLGFEFSWGKFTLRLSLRGRGCGFIRGGIARCGLGLLSSFLLPLGFGLC